MSFEYCASELEGPTTCNLETAQQSSPSRRQIPSENGACMACWSYQTPLLELDLLGIILCIFWVLWYLVFWSSGLGP